MATGLTGLNSVTMVTIQCQENVIFTNQTPIEMDMENLPQVGPILTYAKTQG